MASILRFLIMGDDVSGSRAFDQFGRSVDRANRQVERSNKVNDDQARGMKTLASGVVGVTGAFTGFGDVQTLCSKKSNLFIKALAGLQLATSVAEPAMAGLIVTTGALSSALVAGSLGLGAFAAAVIPAVQQTAALVKAQKTAATGVAQSQKYIDALKAAPPVVQAFARELQAAGNAYSKWAAGLAAPVLQPLRSALGLVNPLLHQMTPFTLAAAGALNQLVVQMRTAASSSGFHDWLAKMLPSVRPVILDLGHIVGNLITGIGGIASAFTPVVTQILGGITNLTAKFAKWGTTLTGHSGFQALMNMFRQETPLAVQVLKNLGAVVVNITSAMAGLASPGNSRALLQILMPVTSIMRILSQNQFLARTVLYFVAMAAVMKRLSPLLTSLGVGMGAFRAGTGFLPKAVALLQQFSAGLSSATAAGLPVTGLAGTLGGKLSKAIDKVAGGTGVAALAMSKWKIGMDAVKGVASALAPTVGVIGGMTLAFAGLANVMGRNLPTVDGFVQALRDQFRLTGWNVTGYNRFAESLKHVTAFQVENAGITEKVNGQFRIQGDQLGRVQRNYNAYGQATDQLNVKQQQAEAQARRINTALSDMQRQYGLTRPQMIAVAGAAGTTADQFARGGKATQDAKNAIADYIAQAALSHDPAKQVANDLNTIGNKAASANDQLGALNSTLQLLVGGYNDLIGVHVAAAQALADLAKKVHDTGTQTGFATQKQRDLTSQLVTTTKSTLDFASATFKQTGNVGKSIRPLVGEVQQIVNLGLKGPVAKQETNRLTGSIIQLGQKGGWSDNKIANLISRILKIPKKAAWELVMKGTGTWTAHQAQKLITAHGGVGTPGNVRVSAAGGEIRGPGGPTDDRAGLFALSNKEWVIRANAATRYGPKAMAAVNQGTARISAPGLADGGQATLTGNLGVLSGKYAEDDHQRTYTGLRNLVANQMWAAMSRQMRAFAGGGGAIVADAMRWIRKIPYVWGGTAVPGGADCSGFVQTIYGRHGINAPRTSEAQGRWVKRSGPAPGGLAFYHSPAGGADPGHVAIVRDGQSVISQGGGMGPVVMGLRGMPLLWTGVPPGGFRRGSGGGVGPSASGAYSVNGMSLLWRQAGGPARAAHLMGAIGMAESGGNPRARNPSGAAGLWQILGLPFPGNPYKPITNAQMAVSKYRSQGLGAWAVYNSGAYRQYMAQGGRISEPVAGVGLHTGAGYMLGEAGTEVVSSQADLKTVAALLTAVLGELRKQTVHAATGPERTGRSVGAALNGSSRRVALDRG